MEHCIIYISTARHLMAESELKKILETSRMWNSKHNVTGMLIYIEGWFAISNDRNIEKKKLGRFMQVLEGEANDLKYLFKKIQDDSRHFNIIEMENSIIPEKNFGSWTMGFQSLTIDEFKNKSAFFNLNSDFFNDLNGNNHALQFMKSFYQRGISNVNNF